MNRDIGLPSSAAVMKRQVPRIEDPQVARDVRPVFASRSRMPDSCEALRPNLPIVGGIPSSAEILFDDVETGDA